jgi:hypothetical protein
LFGFLVAWLVTGCQIDAGMKVETHWGPSVKSAGFGPSFDWIPEAVRGTDEMRAANPEANALIQAIVETELLAKGYVKNTAGSAELWVDYWVARKSRPDDVGHGWHEQGSLILDLVDAGSRQRILRGIAQATVKDDDPPTVRRKRVTRAVRRILAKFPASDE